MTKHRNEPVSEAEPNITHVGPESPYNDLHGDDFVAVPNGSKKTNEETRQEAHDLLAYYLGGEQALQKVLGRPSLESSTPHGLSPNRQVRLGPELDADLTTYIQANHTNRSEVMRQALRAWLTNHSNRKTTFASDKG